MADAAWAEQDVSDVLQLDDGETEEPKLLTPSDVLDMAAYLEIDTVNEIWLFPLARDAVLAELPEGWEEATLARITALHRHPTCSGGH